MGTVSEKDSLRSKKMNFWVALRRGIEGKKQVLKFRTYAHKTDFSYPRKKQKLFLSATYLICNAGTLINILYNYFSGEKNWGEVV